MCRKSVVALIVLVTGACGTGCSADFAVPQGAKLACTAAADCPAGWTCNTKVGTCVRTEEIDAEAPSISGEVTVTPALLKKNAAASVAFEVSETLAVPPVVTVNAGTARALALDDGQSAGGRYVYTYTAAGDEPQRTDCPITIVLTDAAGNESGKLSGRSLKFDFKAPSLSNVLVTEHPVKGGGAVTVAFTVDEQPADDPVVALALDSGPVAFVKDPSTDGLNFVYTHTADRSEPEDAAGVGVTVELADEAGNAIAVRLDRTARFDFTDPGLKGVPVVTPAVARAGTTVTVAFTTTEDLGANLPVVTVGTVALAGRALPGNAYEYGYKVEKTDIDGERAISIALVDPAGNEAAALDGGRFTVDSTLPEVKNLAAAPARLSARAGHEVVTATFDCAEDVGAGVAATIGPRAMDCGAWRPAAPNYACTYVVKGDEGAGVKEISVTTTDGAGNTGFGSRTVELDFAGPFLTLAVQPSGRPARLGELVTVGVASDEALDAGGIVLSAGVLALGAPSGSGSSFSWTYAVKATDDGTFALSATATDVVGNPAAEPATASLALDGVVPTVSGATLNPGRVAKGGAFTLTFTVSEAPGADPAVSFSNGVDAPVPMSRSSVAGLVYTYAGVAPDEGVEPFYTVTASVTDAAGNRTVAAAGTVEIDNVAPELVGLEVAPAGAKVGDTVRAVLTANETLAGPPALTATAAGGAAIMLVPEDLSPGRMRYAYTYEVTAATPQDTYTIQPFNLDDEALNRKTGANTAPARSFAVDSTVPAVTGVVVAPARTDETGTVTVSFDLSEDVGDAPPRMDVKIGGRAPDACGHAGSAPVVHYTCTYAMKGTEIAAGTEAAQTVIITASDLTGNAGTASGGVVFDFKDPAIVGTVQIALVPGAGNPLSSVMMVTDKTTVRVAFTVSEPLAADPVVATSAPEALAFTLLSGAGTTSYVFAHTLTGLAHAQGAYAVGTTLTDLAGNSVPVTLGSFTVDTQAPGRPDAATQGAIVYRRVPWGSDASGGEKRFSIQGLAAAVESNGSGDALRNTVVVAFDGPDTATAAEIGRAAASADGSFGDAVGGAKELRLNRADRQGVYVAAVDAAGNVSDDDGSGANGLQATLVRDVHWTATMGYKIPGSSFENPCVAASTAAFLPTRAQDPALTRELSAGDLAAVRRVDAAGARRSAEARWVSIPMDAGPSPRAGSAIAYDSARGKIALFGGADLSFHQDTWDWDGAASGWSDRTMSGTRPLPRKRHGLVYDEGRGTVLLFGGISNTLYQDTWEWDPATGVWTDRTPQGASPSPRASFGMAYDAARAKVVLFGGDTDVWAGQLQDTWEWDGAAGTWTDRTAAGLKPAARGWTAMAYDAARRKVLVFGGALQGTALYQDTWEWDGAAGTWADRTPAGLKPGARQLAAMAYDGDRGVHVMHGGYDGGYLQDTWEWNGGTGAWTSRVVAGAKPSLRYLHAMAYDALRRRTVLFGGSYNATFPADAMWEWDGTAGAWTERPATGQKPAAREKAPAALDNTGKVLLFGGLDSSAFSDTWVYDGLLSAWAQLSPSGTPPTARYNHGTAYDSARGVTVLFGGNTWDNRVYEWTGTTKTWALRAPTGTPPAGREGAATAFDSGRGKTVIFGGYSAFTNYDDTWEWDGAANKWTNRTTGVRPPAREDAAMAYDAGRGRMVLFGGIQDATIFQDTWEWEPVTGAWTERVIAGTRPTTRYGSSLVYDPQRQRVILFSGTVTDDMWEWDGAAGTWTDRSSSGTAPVPRNHFGMVYDAARKRIVTTHGSSSGSGPLKDTWDLADTSENRPGQLLQVPFVAASSEMTPAIREVAASFRAGGSGYSGGARNGVELMSWEQGRWVTVATNADGAGAPGTVQWSTTDAVTIPRLFHGPQRTLHFAVSPAYPTGAAAAMGEVAVDYAEVTVKYRLP